MNKAVVILLLLVAATCSAIDAPDTLILNQSNLIEDVSGRGGGFLHSAWLASSTYLDVTGSATGYVAYIFLNPQWKDTLQVYMNSGWMFRSGGLVMHIDTVLPSAIMTRFNGILKPVFSEDSVSAQDWDISGGLGAYKAFTTLFAANEATGFSGYNTGDGTGYDCTAPCDSVTYTADAANFWDTAFIPGEYIQDMWDNNASMGLRFRQITTGGQFKVNTHEDTDPPYFFIIMISPLDSLGYEDVTKGTGGIEATFVSSFAPTTNYGSATPMNITKSAFPQVDNVLIRPVSFSHLSLTSSTLGACSLFVRGTATTAGYVDAHIMNRGWTEGGATYNTYDGSNSWSSVGGTDSTSDCSGAFGSFYMDADQYYGVEIPLDSAKAWLDAGSSNGVILRGRVNTIVGTIVSDEGTADNAPYFRLYPATSEPATRKRTVVFYEN